MFVKMATQGNPSEVNRLIVFSFDPGDGMIFSFGCANMNKNSTREVAIVGGSTSNPKFQQLLPISSHEKYVFEDAQPTVITVAETNYCYIQEIHSSVLHSKLQQDCFFPNALLAYFIRRNLDKSHVQFLQDAAKIVSSDQLQNTVISDNALFIILLDHSMGAIEFKQNIAIVPPNSTMNYVVELVSFGKEMTWNLRIAIRIDTAGRSDPIFLAPILIAIWSGKHVENFWVVQYILICLVVDNQFMKVNPYS